MQVLDLDAVSLRKCALKTFNVLFESTENKNNMVPKLLAQR